MPRGYVNRPEIALAARELGRSERNYKNHSDISIPRIKRNRDGLMPGQIVCLDVHPVDVLVKRADGTEATPRLIGFLDIATNQLTYTLKLCNQNTSITQVDLVKAVVDMILKWGLPENIQLDNGSENKYQAFLDGFKNLLLLRGSFRDLVYGDDLEHPLRDYPFIVALPHRPSSKPIEGIFSALEKKIQGMDGSIGGNRMEKRTHNKERQTRPYPGTWEQFEIEFSHLAEDYNDTPQRGMKGLSPNQKRQEFNKQFLEDESLFRPSAITRDVLFFAFSEDRQGTLGNQGIAANGFFYRSDKLLQPGVCGGRDFNKLSIKVARWENEFIWVHLPDPLSRKKTWKKVPKVIEFGYIDSAGAKEQARLAGVKTRALRELAGNIQPIDMTAENARHALALLPAPPVMTGPDILLDEDHRQVAADAGKAAPVASLAPKAGPLERIHGKTGEVVPIVPHVPMKPAQKLSTEQILEKVRASMR